MDVLNMNTHQVSVRCDTADGKTDFVTVAARRRVRLPADLQVNINWLAGEPNLKTFENDSDTAIVLTPIPVPMQIIPAPSAPAPTPTPKAPAEVVEPKSS